ncbi:DUF6493 family protein [Asanoa iriomotensis]|uniref:Secreted protein n=1 Tax=Asanoa iriomotensis TaxID=234613 RepID=A0ABQ4C9X2_9ACTN|nr:DUF6493 family protein [Asanoa iriomotensis]GIF59544.1 hypothetical protein Air01nite_56390 [Asanoa iriomotensis]
MTPVDRLLTELRALPAEDRHPVSLLRSFYELGEVSEPPAVEPPEWLGRAVAEGVTRVAAGWPMNALFGAVRMLERLGLAKLDHDDTYVLAMVSCLGDRWDGAVRTEALRRDPELRELVWRVFEVEGGGEVSLANVDKFSEHDATWAQTFQVLVADGTLARDRVLRSCLQALGRDFSAYRAGWFAQLYRSLDPSTAERVAHQPLLLHLLRSAVPTTVSFAVAQLAFVAKAGALDDDGYTAEAAAAVVAPAKSTAVSAISLAAAVATRRPDLAPAVAEAVGAGLGHAHRDVQSRALAVLRSSGARDIVAARLDELEPSVHRTASDWLGVPMARPLAEDPEEPTPTVAADATVAELGARLLAGHLDALDVERFLAALAVGDHAGLDALRKQAARVLADTRWDRSLRRHIAALIVGGPKRASTGPGTFLARRLGEVAARRPAAPLLATPTDSRGWLDPSVFADRLAANPEPRMFDLVAALLRLAPDGHAEALRSAGTLPGEPGAVARYALGGAPAETTTAAWWVAAARSRKPLTDDPHLVAAGLDRAGQGRAAEYRLRLGKTAYDSVLEVDPAGARERADQPTVVGPSSVWPGLDADWIPWHAAIWPHDAEPFFAVRAAEVLTASSPHPDVTYGTSAILDTLVTHPGRLGPMAATTLAAGLSAAEVRHRVLAAEACARLVPAGRITAEDLAGAMAHLAGHCTATRWAATLRDAARTGPAASAAVVEVLDHLLPRLAANHPGLHALLETRHEEAVRLGRGAVGDPMLTWLRTVTGGSKAARLARLVLAEAAHGSGQP